MIDDLRREWARLLPGVPAVGEELLARWSEPHRRYHDLGHLAETLSAVVRLGVSGPAERLALWFHDAVHQGDPGRDERRSAELADARLTASGVERGLTAEVVRLVLVTAHHRPAPGDTAGARVSDADLAVLGADSARYAASVVALRAEVGGRLTEAEWWAARRLRVTELLAADPLFHTAAGSTLWHRPAVANLTAELAELDRVLGRAGAG